MSGTKRHKTHNQEKIRNRSAPDAPWTSLTAVSAFYPVPPATPRDAQIIAYEFGRMLTLGPELITDAIARLGLWHVLKVQDRIAQGIDRIRNPEAYLRRILAQVVPVENARRISPMKDRSAQPSSEYPVCRASVP